MAARRLHLSATVAAELIAVWRCALRWRTHRYAALTCSGNVLQSGAGQNLGLRQAFNTDAGAFGKGCFFAGWSRADYLCLAWSHFKLIAIKRCALRWRATRTGKVSCFGKVLQTSSCKVWFLRPANNAKKVLGASAVGALFWPLKSLQNWLSSSTSLPQRLVA
jgi:hypothetical protein